MAVAVFSYGWVKGANSELSKQQIINQNQVIHALQTKIKQAEISERVVTQYVDRIKIVKTQGDTIIKQVPIYITQDNDRECIVPESFRLLWNAANRGDIPEAAINTLSNTAITNALESGGAIKLMGLLSNMQVVVTCENGAPCFATASQVIFRLLKIR